MLKRNINMSIPFCWHIKEKVKKKTHSIFTLKKLHMGGFKNMFMEFDELESSHVALKIHPNL